jgi:hypothetical protein
MARQLRIGIDNESLKKSDSLSSILLHCSFHYCRVAVSIRFHCSPTHYSSTQRYLGPSTQRRFDPVARQLQGSFASHFSGCRFQVWLLMWKTSASHWSGVLGLQCLSCLPSSFLPETSLPSGLAPEDRSHKGGNPVRCIIPRALV